MNISGQIFRISTSIRKGTKKNNTDHVELNKDYGIIGDAHAGSKRQVSLLPYESFAKVFNEVIDINPGDFAENITTIGIGFSNAKIGKRIIIGKNVELEITRIGKECHRGCHISKIVGDCIMPREGIFARVVKGGKIKVGDKIKWRKV